jgi:methyltransferase family protein
LADNAKRLAKDLVRPVFQPLLARIEFLHDRIDSVETHLHASNMAEQARAAAVERQVATVHHTVNQLLDAISMQNGLARQSRRAWEENVESIWETQAAFSETLSRFESRLEFIRKEVMIEVSHGNGAPGSVPADEPEVLNRDKLAMEPLRLNLGCGHIPIDDFVNVDGRPLPGVDLVAEVGKLPFERGSVDQIHSSHLLEHFPPQRLKELLPYWFDLLRPRGQFTAIVPDAEAMIRNFATGDIPWDDLKEVTFGGQEYSGDFHFTMFSQADLIRLLEATGFVDVNVVEAARANGLCLEMEVEAFKADDP